jgi:hypothetical protein
MEAKKKALSNGWIDNVDHSYKYWSNQIDLRHIRELIRQKEWEKNNRLYLRRIKANSREHGQRIRRPNDVDNPPRLFGRP